MYKGIVHTTQSELKRHLGLSNDLNIGDIQYNQKNGDIDFIVYSGEELEGYYMLDANLEGIEQRRVSL